MTIDDTFPDTAVRHFTEHAVRYPSGLGPVTIDLYRRNVFADRVQVAHIETLPDDEAEVADIPGPGSGENSHLRVLNIKMHRSRLCQVLQLLSLPGIKTIFVNDEDEFWSITNDSIGPDGSWT